MGKLAGRVALLIGAGTGIGRATARLFAAEGATVVVAMRTEVNGRKTAEEIRAAGGEADYVVGDAGVRDDCARMVAETARLYGRLDILVHNAAFLAPGPVDTLSDDDLDKAIDTNLKACFWLVRAAAPLLKQAGGKGRVIVTTTPAMRTAVCMSLAAATKGSGAAGRRGRSSISRRPKDFIIS